MIKVEKLIKEAHDLSGADRLRPLEAVERSLVSCKANVASRPMSYTSLVSIAGSFPSDFSDVSTEKYRHLADAFAPRTGRRRSRRPRPGLAQDGENG